MYKIVAMAAAVISGKIKSTLARALRLCDSNHLQLEINAKTTMLMEPKFPDKLIFRRLALVQEKELRRNHV